MSKNKSKGTKSEEKPLKSVKECHEIGIQLWNYAQLQMPDMLSNFYNTDKCIKELHKVMGLNGVTDFAPFANAWLKMLNHYIESALWCSIFNSNRLVLDDRKSMSMADEALKGYRTMALKFDVE